MSSSLFSFKAGQSKAPRSSNRQRADEVGVVFKDAVLVPAEGCLAGEGRWVLRLADVASRCVRSLPWTRSRAAVIREDLPSVVERALSSADLEDGLREVVVGVDVDPWSLSDKDSRVLARALEIIVSAGASLRVCTRGAPRPETPIGSVLARAAKESAAALEVSMISTASTIASTYEPGFPPAKQRLQAARRLSSLGVRIEGRLEPMLPWISDTTAHLESAVEAFEKAGARSVRAAYIQLEPKGAKLLRRLPSAHRALLKGCFRGRPRHPQEALLLPRDLRTKGYSRLRRLARRSSICVLVCEEANPDLKVAEACLSRKERGSIGTSVRKGARASNMLVQPTGALTSGSEMDPQRERRAQTSLLQGAARREGTDGREGQLELFRG